MVHSEHEANFFALNKQVLPPLLYIYYTYILPLDIMVDDEIDFPLVF
jgi:hypothetical protein